MIPVHNHSEFSALDGYSRPAEIADRIEELGLQGAFLTDHGTVAGLSSFAKAMKAKDLFCGFGIEAYQARNSRFDRDVTENDKKRAFRKGEDSFHLILLAKNLEGYRNLLRISDESHRSGFYYDPRVDWELLKKYREGLICTTACLGSLVCQTLMEDPENTDPLDRLGNIFGEDFYVELNTYATDEQVEVNKVLISLAQERGIPLLYANDAHYARPELYELHEALLCAQYGEKLDVPKRSGEMSYHPPCLYIMSEDEVREALSDLPQKAVDEAIRNSDLLMEQCNFELPKPGQFLPKFKVPKDYEDSEDMLVSLVCEGILERYANTKGEVPGDVIERAEYETDAIIEAGLQDYFLIVWDYINYALDQGVLVGPGRGSVGGSILAYALGITTIDPLKYGLQFERFWNPGRADGLPDIDVDFEQSARQFMIDYAKRKYGEDHVLPISNHIYLRPKSAIDKAGMVLYEKPPYGLMETVKRIIDTTTDAGQVKPWGEMWETLGRWAKQEGKAHPLEKYRKEYPDLFDLAELLAGRLNTYGVHASAVVISDVPLSDHLPARMAKDDDDRKVVVTQAEMKQVEKEGFPKFDFLGLKNLDTIMMAAVLSGDFCDPDEYAPRFMKLIEERRKGAIELTDNDLREVLKSIIKHIRNDVNYNHLADSYWEQIDKTHTLGLFQIEEGTSPKRIGKHLRPRDIEDLAAIVALNRPGPLRDKDERGRSTVDRFLARRNEEEAPAYLHEILEPILEPTYGDFLYQEQVIAYFRAIGYSLSDADHIRKILGKKLVSAMQAEFPRYMERAQQHMSKQAAEAIWHSIEEFSKYSFNKAHAVGYGMILAWTVYAKKKWATEFIMAAIMTSPKRVAQFVNEARRIGVEVLPPDINTSAPTISKSELGIHYGLIDIKGIGMDAAKWVTANGPYESPEDFYRRAMDAEPIVVKKNHRAALMDAGCFDSFGYRLGPCEECEERGKVGKMVPKKSGDGEKRVLVPCENCDALGYVPVDIPDDRTKAKFEEELFGIVLVNLYKEIIAEYQERIEALDAITEADTDEEIEVNVPGVVSEVEQKVASWYVEPGKPKDWAHIKIQWGGEEIKFAAFPKEFRKYKYMLEPGVIGEFRLKTSPKGPQLKKAEKYIV